MAAFVSVYRERPAFVVIWLRGRGNQAVATTAASTTGASPPGCTPSRPTSACSPRAPPSASPSSPSRSATVSSSSPSRTPWHGDPEVLAEAERAVVGYLQLHAAPQVAGTSAALRTFRLTPTTSEAP